jgi:RNA polymerase sigma factor (sigma-70 family)
MSDELFEKARRDSDRRLLERVAQEHRPLVQSACRRLLRDPADVEDATQETFLKLTQHTSSITGSITGWLVATAKASSVDLIRRSIRQQNRRHGLAQISSTQIARQATQQQIFLRLSDAIAAMEPQERALIQARFVNNKSLRELATEHRTSVPTMSRRVAASLHQLGEVLQELGVVGPELEDDDALAAMLHANPGDMNLRFAPDWRAAEFAPLGAPADAVLFPTGSRPLRVGVMVSYESTITRGWHNFFGSMSGQVQSTPLFPATGLQMVGVVEPGTVHRGIVERTLRDYSLIGGLVEADDVLGLATLDVLLIGNNFALSPNIISAINRAVRGGVGLLNEYWTRAHQGIVKDRCLQELMLADSQYY